MSGTSVITKSAHLDRIADKGRTRSKLQDAIKLGFGDVMVKVADRAPGTSSRGGREENQER